VATISSFFFLAFAFDFGAASFERFMPVFCSSMGTMAAGAEAAVSILSAKNSSSIAADDAFPVILVRA
jgi:hypothetical protein